VNRGLVAAAVVAVAAGAAAAWALRDGDDGAPSAASFEGAWDVSLVVGAVDADPGADPASFPGDATFRERWVFDDCDDATCTLHRPDGGLLLGDLDDVPFAFATLRGVDDAERFTGEGVGEAPVAAGGDDDHADPCAGTPAQRWTVRIELRVAERVLSGTVLRTPDARRHEVEGVTCYGLDLTLGFSGVPAAAGQPQPSG
jgi:hypothetical protein